MKDKQIEMYLKGNCHIFAMALHELTNLEIAGFIEKRVVYVNNEGEEFATPFFSKLGLIKLKNCKKVADGLIHAFCLLPDKGEIIFDAKGIRHVDDLNDEYNFHSNVKVKFFYEPNDLLQFDISFNERTKEVELAIKEAKKFIRANFRKELRSLKQ